MWLSAILAFVCGIIAIVDMSLDRAERKNNKDKNKKTK